MPFIFCKKSINTIFRTDMISLKISDIPLFLKANNYFEKDRETMYSLYDLWQQFSAKPNLNNRYGTKYKPQMEWESTFYPQGTVANQIQSIKYQIPSQI